MADWNFYKEENEDEVRHLHTRIAISNPFTHSSLQPDPLALMPA